MNSLLLIAALMGSLVGQSEPAEDGTVICYYRDFNTGAQYIKYAMHVCPSQ